MTNRNDLQSNITLAAEHEFLDECDAEPSDAELDEYDRMISVGTFGLTACAGAILVLIDAHAIVVAVGSGIAAGIFTYFSRRIEQRA